MMTEYYCATCGPKWPGTYTCEHRCTQCGSPIRAEEPWREESEADEEQTS